MKRKSETIKGFILIGVLLVLAGLGPSEKQQFVPPDGSLHDPGPVETLPEPPAPTPMKDPMIYREEELKIKGNPQKLFCLELDLSHSGLMVFPVLSQDRIFGFEYLSETDERYAASATVNAGFHYSYGQPAGLVIQNGRILSGSMGTGRILLIKDQKALFQNPPFQIRLQQEGEKLPVDKVNPYPQEKGILIYTTEFGPTNRLEGKSTTCVVENGRVISSKVVDGETPIPKEGFLVVDLRTEDSPLLGFMAGSSIDLVPQEQVDQGYQCSGSLVEKGVNVAADGDVWAGNLQIPTPRTAVGIKDDQTLVFLVVDGRQPGYSIGVTGKQLADILISLGVTEAALLDGGASSQMIVGNKTVNRPSTGKERLLPSAFIIKK